MKSMTGYGSAEGKVGKGRVFIELKSVNHRYCDILIKIPPKMNSLYPAFNTMVKGQIARGKVELFLKERKGVLETRDLSLDLSLARKYHECLEKLQKSLGPQKKEVHLLEVIDARELIKVVELDIDYTKYWNCIKRIVSEALNKLEKMKAREGAYLLKDQRVRLKKVGALVERISRQTKVGLKSYEKRLRTRLLNSVGRNAVPRDRIDTEIAILAEKMDIAEELTRLGSHIKQFGHIIGQKGAVGRQLDFLLQEMNREVNTLGAKSGDAQISKYVVTVKSELEKLREQVQNIE